MAEEDEYRSLVELVNDLRNEVSKATHTISATLDAAGLAAGNASAARLDVEKIRDRVTNLETIAGATHIEMEHAEHGTEDHEVRLRELEKWQRRSVGMMAVLVAEIPIAIGLFGAVWSVVHH